MTFKKSKAGGRTPPCFRTYSRAHQNSVVLARRQTHKAQNGIESPEINPCVYCPLLHPCAPGWPQPPLGQVPVFFNSACHRWSLFLELWYCGLLHGEHVTKHPVPMLGTEPDEWCISGCRSAFPESPRVSQSERARNWNPSNSLLERWSSYLLSGETAT